MEDNKRNISKKTCLIVYQKKVKLIQEKALNFWLNQKLFSIESVALIISIIAIIISFFANQLAKESNKLSIHANQLANEANDIYKQELTLTHRPYLWVENFAYLNEKNQTVNEIGTSMFVVINSPAQVISSEMIYKVIKDKTEIEVVRFIPQNGVLYPSEKTQYSSFIGLKEREELLKYINNGYEAYRTCYVEYKMVSGDKKFTYKAKWRFNKSNRNWVFSDEPEVN